MFRAAAPRANVAMRAQVQPLAYSAAASRTVSFDAARKQTQMQQIAANCSRRCSPTSSAARSTVLFRQ
jgi:hypothetical protein